VVWELKGGGEKRNSLLYSTVSIIIDTDIDTFGCGYIKYKTTNSEMRHDGEIAEWNAKRRLCCGLPDCQLLFTEKSPPTCDGMEWNAMGWDERHR
jgi:hypothetical protein